MRKIGRRANQRFTVTILERFDIDRRQLRTLFLVYFRQDFRSSKSFLQQGRTEYVTSNSAVLSLLGLYLLTGLFISLAAFFATALSFSILMVSYTFFIVALTIIAESGNVIFNESETDILGHLPLSSRTLFAAKVLNLFSFTALLAVAVNFFPMLFGVWATGSNLLFPVGHLLAALGVSVFSASLVISGYGLLIRYVDKERFNNIVAYSQAALTIFFILGYQLMPRLMDTQGGGFVEANPGYFLLFPPAWFSGFAMLVMGRVDGFSLLLAALALVSLAFVTTLAMRKVSAGYSGFVSRLASDSGRHEGRAAARPSLLGRVKPVILRNPAERAVFDLVSTYLKRDREVKVRFYPTFADLLMFPVIGYFSAGLPDPFTDLAEESNFQTLAGAAMIPFLAMTAVETLIFSEHYRATYIFRVAPVARLRDVHAGVRKAIFVYVAVPGAMALTLLYAVLWQNPVHALLVTLPWLLLTPVMMLIPFMRRQRLPLSRKYQKGQQSARSIFLMMAVFFVLLFIGGMQSRSFDGQPSYPLFLAGFLLLASLAYLILRRLNGESAPLSRLTESSDN